MMLNKILNGRWDITKSQIASAPQFMSDATKARPARPKSFSTIHTV
jgi:hypothetical protein